MDLGFGAPLPPVTTHSNSSSNNSSLSSNGGSALLRTRFDFTGRHCQRRLFGTVPRHDVEQFFSNFSVPPVRPSDTKRNVP